MRRLSAGFGVVCALLFCVTSLSAEPPLKLTSAPQPTFEELSASFDQFWANRPQEKGKGFKPFNRIRAFTATREQPDGSFDPSAILQGWQEKRNRFAESNPNANWTPLGPFSPVPLEYAGGMGRVSAIAVDPVTPTTLYVGAATGGLWKSVDDGATWAPLTDQLPVLGVSDIEINPADPDVIYLVTGDTDGARRRTVSYSIGLVKSMDGGETWSQLGLTAQLEEGEIFTRLVLYPGSPDTMIAAGLGGLHRSIDGGETWTTVAEGGDWYDLEVDPNNGLRWYAAAAGNGVYRSLDGGITWLKLSGGLRLTGFSRIALAVAPSNADTLYALFAKDTLPFYNGMLALYRSDDGGDTFLKVTYPDGGDPNLLGWNSDGSDTGGQGWFALAMAVNPNNSSDLYVGSVNLWHNSAAGIGNSWEIAGYWYYSDVEYIHADQHIFEFLNGRLYVGNDGGLYRHEDNGKWTDLSNLLVISQIYRLGLWQGGDEVSLMLNGNQDNGTKLMRGTEWTAVIGGDGFECAIESVTPDTMYGQIYYSQVYRSLDGGESFTSGNNNVVDAGNGYWSSPLALDPTTPGRLYRGSHRIYQSEDAAENWTDLTGEITQEYIHNIAVAPSDPNVIYANDWDGKLFVTLDMGEHWETLATPMLKVTYLTVDPTASGVLYATVGNFDAGTKVFRSEDFGATWDNLSGDLPNVPANTIVVHPENRYHLYLGTDIGVFVSLNAGESWEAYDAGLPNVIVNELEIHKNSNTLVAATWGRGDWQSPLVSPLGVQQNPVATPTEWAISSIYPNPFNSSTRIEVELPESAHLEVELLSIGGRHVRTLASGEFSAGRQIIPLDGVNLASGIYLVRVRVPGKLDQTRRVALIR